MIDIIVGIIYYIFSSIAFTILIDCERIVGLSNFDFVICLIPIVRIVYWIYVKFI